jgi:DNA-directed RNA polymerase subunit H (RpoH/RPB5)
MSTVSARLISIYKSRSVILEQLEEKGYDVSEYLRFNINEIDAMLANGQLDMLITHPDTKEKVYIKYYFTTKQTTRQIRPATLDEIIEDLYTIEEVMTKKDTLIVIIDDEPNDTILAKMRYLYDHDGIFVIIHNIKRLQFNILKHELVPPMRVLSEKETLEFKRKYNLKDLTKDLPEISRFDAQALAVGVRPGQVCLIDRSSATALSYEYYRVCV